MKFIFNRIVVTSIGLCLLSCSKELTPPNIIFIMSDDHSERAISAYGSKLIET
ncbi:uncharacterized protein METZ01_LOCUS67407, partial [marine metagenome]